LFVNKRLSEEIASLALVFWSWIVAIVVLLPFAIKSLWAQRSWLKENLGYLSLASLLGVTLFNSMIYSGQTSSAINLSLIAITFPILVLILSGIFLADMIGWNKFVAITHC
jgi:drug/metabolite transporter (DMT)-like permease